MICPALPCFAEKHVQQSLLIFYYDTGDEQGVSWTGRRRARRCCSFAFSASCCIIDMSNEKARRLFQRRRHLCFAALFGNTAGRFRLRSGPSALFPAKKTPTGFMGQAQQLRKGPCGYGLHEQHGSPFCCSKDNGITPRHKKGLYYELHQDKIGHYGQQRSERADQRDDPSAG